MARQYSGVILSPDILKDVEKTLLVSLNEDEDDKHIFEAKIDILQKVLRHSMSRFSIGRMHNVLQILVRLVALQESGVKSTSPDQTPSHTPNNVRITSVGQLREILKSLDEYDKRTGLSTNQTKVVQFLRNFLTDIASIKKVKQQFDKGVFEYLKTLQHAFSRQETDMSKSRKGKGRLGRQSDIFNESDSGNFSQTELDEQEASSKSGQQFYTQLGFSSADHIDGNMNEKLKITVKELDDVSKRWSRLLQDGDLDINDFDPESHHEISHLTGYSEFELVFRLFPDMFAKCYKCIELSKQWWSLINENKEDSQRTDGNSSENATKILSKPHEDITHIEINSPINSITESHYSQEEADSLSQLRAINTLERDATDVTDVNNNTPRSDTTYYAEVNGTAAVHDISVSSYSECAARGISSISTDKEYHTTIQQPLTLNKSISNSNIQPIAGSPLIQINGVTKIFTPDSLESNSPEKDKLQLKAMKCLKNVDNKVFTSQTFTKLPHGDTRKQSRLDDVNRLIVECESQWQRHHDDSAIMQSRENRLLTMSGIWGKLGQTLTEVTGKYNKEKGQRKELAQKFSYTIRGTSKYFDLREKVRECEVRLREYDQTMRLLKYQQAVIGQDYMLEMELRPNFIRVSANIQQCMKEIVHRITELKFEKFSIEKDLGLTKEIFCPSTVSYEIPTNEVIPEESAFTPDFPIYDTSQLFDHRLPNSGNNTSEGSVSPPVSQKSTGRSVSSAGSRIVHTHTEIISPKLQETQRLSSATNIRHVSNKDKRKHTPPHAKVSSSRVRNVTPKEQVDALSPISKGILSPTAKAKLWSNKDNRESKIPRANDSPSKTRAPLRKEPEMTVSYPNKISILKETNLNKIQKDTTIHRYPDKHYAPNTKHVLQKEPGYTKLPRVKEYSSKESDASHNTRKDKLTQLNSKDVNSTSKVRDISQKDKGHTLLPRVKDVSHKDRGNIILSHPKVTKDRLSVDMPPTVTSNKGQNQLTKPKTSVKVHQNKHSNNN